MESAAEIDQNKLWSHVVDGVDKKGRMYGTGNALCEFLDTPLPRRSYSKKKSSSVRSGRSQADPDLRAQNEQLRAQVEALEKWKEEVNRHIGYAPPGSCNQGPNPFSRDRHDDGGSGASDYFPVR